MLAELTVIALLALGLAAGLWRLLPPERRPPEDAWDQLARRDRKKVQR